MSDNTIRDQLAEILRAHINFFDDEIADAPDVILSEFLVVPRSEITDPIAAELLSVPVGFVVLAKRPDRHEKDAFRYEVAGSIWPTRDPVENHQAYCEDTAAADPERYQGVEYVIGEVREVPDGP